MKTLILTLLALWAIDANAGELYQRQAMAGGWNIGVPPPRGVSVANWGSGTNRLNWVNKTGQIIYIYGIQVEFWCDPNCIADMSAMIWRWSDRNIVVNTGWDHYANPSAPQSGPVMFAPNYISLQPNDELYMIAMAFNGASLGSPQNPGYGGVGITVNVFYTVGQP